MPRNILLTADLHIGLTSTRIGHSSSRREFSTAQAWRRIVDLAKTESVEALLLAGDIVDQNNKFFEAIGPLQRGIQELGEAGIVTIAVSGNHDHDVLKRLAAELPQETFRLLGADGNWERTSVDHGGDPVLHVDGVSFPTASVQRSSHDSYDAERNPFVPTIGIVHGDLYDKGSRYRPLDPKRLQASAVDGWLLGHIHAQELIEAPGSPWILYPGSPQALDPGEQGIHGAWIAEIDGSVVRPPVHQPLSSVLYTSVNIDLSGMADRDELEGSITGQLRDHASNVVAGAGSALRLAMLRCRLRGTTPLADQVASVAARLKDELELEIGNVIARVDTYTVDVVPPIDLDQYSDSNTAPGAIARLLLGLYAAEPTDEIRNLIESAMEELRRVDAQSEYADLEPPPVTDEMAKEYLRTQAQALLTELVKDEL